jgi:hypothetical protein
MTVLRREAPLSSDASSGIEDPVSHSPVAGFPFRASTHPTPGTPLPDFYLFRFRVTATGVDTVSRGPRKAAATVAR